MIIQKKAMMIKIYEYFTCKINFARKRVVQTELHIQTLVKKIEYQKEEEAPLRRIISIYILGVRKKTAEQALKKCREDLTFKKNILAALLKAKLQEPLNYINADIACADANSIYLPDTGIILNSTGFASSLQKELHEYRDFLLNVLSQKQGVT